MRLRYKARLRHLLAKEKNPRSIATGLAIGLFISMTPLVGLHILLSVLLASVANGSKLAATAGALFTNPLSAPFFYAGAYAVGRPIVGTKEPFFIPTSLSAEQIEAFLGQGWSVLLSLTVGGVLLGIVLAVSGYYLSLRLMRKWMPD